MAENGGRRPYGLWRRHTVDYGIAWPDAVLVCLQGSRRQLTTFPHLATKPGLVSVGSTQLGAQPMGAGQRNAGRPWRRWEGREIYVTTMYVFEMGAGGAAVTKSSRVFIAVDGSTAGGVGDTGE